MNKKFIFSRALSMAKKEVRHILRDKLTLTMALGMPVIMVFFFGYVFDFDVRDIPMTVVDRDQTSLSRQLVDVFRGSQYFKVAQNPAQKKPLRLLESEQAKAVLIIEPGFAKNIRRGQPAAVQVVVDGADNQTASTIVGYLAGLQLAAIKELIPLSAPQATIDLQSRFLFNTELNSRWFVIPGLTVVVVGILAVLLTALTVAREWESGSMELLLSTPVQPLEIIVGKLAPYTILGLGGIALVYLAARFGFGVPFKGNHILFIVSCLMFLATTLSQGLVISVITRQQQLAMQMANMTGMLPSLLLSGFIFPTQSMPMFFQVVTSIIPARWFMLICRGLFLKGSGFLDLTKPFLALAIIQCLMLLQASRKFKRDLEP